MPKDHCSHLNCFLLLRDIALNELILQLTDLLEFNPAYINFTSHRNETIYHERPDGLLEKRIVRLQARDNCPGSSSKI